jgi:glycerol-3-phosphate acyltransferase PlsX
MRIALDVMGTDRGPAEVVAGGLTALKKHRDVELLMVGDQIVIQSALDLHDAPGQLRSRIEIVHASQVVEMRDKIEVLRSKPDASLMRAVEAMADGRAEALVAPGNTAAVVAMTKIRLGNLEGVPRAGIAVPLPTLRGPCVIIDAGANTKPQPRHLAAYGLMAARYAVQVLGRSEAKVGLLNVGGEHGKGNEFLRKTYELLEKLPIDFGGNMEGTDIFRGRYGAVVCDGFVGNAVLKASEGIASMFLQALREELGKGPFVKFGAALCYRAFKNVRQRFDYASYGGAPLLGVKGTVIIAHGRSDAVAISNAVRVARECLACRLNEVIVEGLKSAGAAPAG